MYRSFIVVIMSIVLLACKGGGGGSDLPNLPENQATPPADTQPPPADPPVDPEFSLSRDNYVEIASAIYNAGVGTAAFRVTLPPLTMFLITIVPNEDVLQDQVEACDEAGEKVVSITRSPVDERKIHVNDARKIELRACDDNGRYEETGSESITVSSLVGEYEGSSDNTVRADSLKDVTRSGDASTEDNGAYRHFLRTTLSRRMGGALNYAGIDIATLHGGVAPPEEEHPFADVIMENISLPEPNPQYMETPTNRFNTFAFERITDDTVDRPRTTMQWLFEIDGPAEAGGVYRFETERAWVLEERTRLDEDGDEETYQYAIDGEFVIRPVTGEVIRVQVTPPDDADVPVDEANVSVVFDQDGDGSFEASASMTWEEFGLAFFGLIADA